MFHHVKPILTTILLSLTAAALTADPIWTLESAVEAARAGNPSAGLAAARLQAAEAAAAEARASAMPSLQLRASYSYTDQPGAAFGQILNQRAFSPTIDFNRPGQTDNLRIAAEAQAPLWDAGENAARRRAALARQAAASLSAEAIQAELAVAAIGAYADLYAAREALVAARASRRLIEELVQVAAEREAGGRLLATETLALRVRLSGARVDELAAEKAAALAERAFARTLGLPLDTGPIEVEPLPQLPPIAPATKEVAGRPELLASEREEAAARAEWEAARSARRPRVDAFASLAHDRGWSTGAEGNSWMLGASVSWPVWDAGRAAARQRQAAAGAAAAQAGAAQVAQTIDLQTVEARLSVVETAARAERYAEGVALAEQQVELSAAGFAAGRLLAVQLIEAETNLLAARAGRVAAQAEHTRARARLARAEGRDPLDF
jgi:outer membrane protein